MKAHQLHQCVTYYSCSHRHQPWHSAVANVVGSISSLLAGDGRGVAPVIPWLSGMTRVTSSHIWFDTNCCSLFIRVDTSSSIITSIHLRSMPF